MARTPKAKKPTLTGLKRANQSLSEALEAERVTTAELRESIEKSVAERNAAANICKAEEKFLTTFGASEQILELLNKWPGASQVVILQQVIINMKAEREAHVRQVTDELTDAKLRKASIAAHLESAQKETIDLAVALESLA